MEIEGNIELLLPVLKNIGAKAAKLGVSSAAFGFQVVRPWGNSSYESCGAYVRDHFSLLDSFYQDIDQQIQLNSLKSPGRSF